MLRLESIELASKFAQSVFGIAKAERASLFESAEGGRDAGKGSLVGCDVEVCDRMSDELESKSAKQASTLGNRRLLLQGPRREA